MPLSLQLTDDPSCLGHHFIVGLSGFSLSDEDRELLSGLRPMGVLLRAPNFRQGVEYSIWLSSLKAMLAEAQSLTGRDKLIVSIDHEGGRIYRVPAPLTHFPDAFTHAKKAAAVAEAMAVELASIGVNLSLAPVADIHSNPTNPVIGKRAFGTTPEEVIQAVVPYAQALLKNKVIPCAKHFPGHGDTSQDSHLELPRVKLTLPELEKRELKPFQALIDSGIPMILTAHIKFLEIDKRNPATLSKKILGEILREKMGFSGVILSDDLDMQAIADNYSEDDIAKRAIPAGLDMFLFNHKPQRGIKLAEAILRGLRTKKIKETMLESSFNRIKHLVDTLLPMHSARILDSKVLAQHARLADSFS
ncbi:MAG: glycoside hydrolase family 3 protein [Deltaproteobacteria bacterium]|nr:glycoside hydrolase family 3 protein [Deltaproteobacteria bacterium]